MIKLIVGLGNPGSEYTSNRHNVGAWLVNGLAENSQLQLKYEKKFQSTLVKWNHATNSIWLAIPATYMNLSGEAVGAICKYYDIEPKQIVVAHDELDFGVGVVKCKFSGGSGGHNGLKSIINHLHTRDFYRIRIGIGHPGHRDKVSSYVLSNPSKSDQQQICDSIDHALQHLDLLIDGRADRYMQEVH